ncbi:thioredoxin-related transmembrane protein 2 homolog [Anthonomus grandis grandis]|uniref:thioredoxin-related transmembrane protein 2 homolog n=1 Tax=Anthonomus grandis grandis TaxID=2921223 RepID=UPI002165D0E4|nr:thioredoxin-related transmembrane protein 2 homolog [Anthonomus grandis grandis]
MSVKKDLLQLLRPYYLVNIILSLSYIVIKRIPGVCNYIFNTDNCEFEGRETEILFFLLIVIVMRTRKTGSVSMISYLSSSFIYTKIANLILWFNADYKMGIVYGILFILGALLVPEPAYSGPNNVIYFKGESDLTEEVSNKTTWLVAFYTAWNPTCVNLAPVFAKLSTSYALDNLKFGKIDIGRYPEAGKKYHVSDSSMSKQLPTIILFQEGKEVTRRPMADAKGKLIKFMFSEENLKMAFGLNNLYETAKKETKSENISNSKKNK